MQYLAVNTLKDNYTWIIYNANKQAIVIDCGEFSPVKQAIQQHGLTVLYILITHHHYDHTQEINQLQAYTQASVVGCQTFANVLPKLDYSFSVKQPLDNIHLNLNNFNVTAVFTPGHSHDHIAYIIKHNQQTWLFSGDLLFNLGAGAIFGGTIPQLLQSLEWLKTLPNTTQVFFGHNYLKTNLAFVNSLNYFNLPPANQLNQHSTPLQQQLQYNPFLHCTNPNFAKHLLNQTQLPSNFAPLVHNTLRYKKTKFLVG